jgi:hypothetical protein
MLFLLFEGMMVYIAPRGNIPYLLMSMKRRLLYADDGAFRKKLTSTAERRNSSCMENAARVISFFIISSV